MGEDKNIGPASAGTFKLLREPLSGHCHRVELFMRVLGLSYNVVDLDVQGGEAKSSTFEAINPLMEVPVLWHGETAICDSNAILVYLATMFDGGTWFPRDPLGMSRVQRWLSIAAGELLNGPVTARRIELFGFTLDRHRAVGESVRLFKIMDAHLEGCPYLLGQAPTIADISLYTYTAHSPEGGVSLRSFVNIRRWIQQIESWPAFIPMQKSVLPSPKS